MSTASVQPGVGNDSGAALPGPNRFSTLRHDTSPDDAISSTARTNASSAPNGTTNWYWQNPRRP